MSCALSKSVTIAQQDARERIQPAVKNPFVSLSTEPVKTLQSKLVNFSGLQSLVKTLQSKLVSFSVYRACQNSSVKTKVNFSVYRAYQNSSVKTKVNFSVLQSLSKLFSQNQVRRLRREKSALDVRPRQHHFRRIHYDVRKHRF